ncbi:pyridoxal-phosphate dependent enzyme [Kitasatospora sp. NPDC049258]|uniref:threonine synthase n=1 Tax=Kitasatospora sp. NPDC049258 TaxID=3155394 RepID=UPI00344722FC
MTTGDSLATGQRSLGDPSIDYPLWPPLTTGCPRTSTAEVAYPVEVDYAYDRVDPQLFDAATPSRPGLERWAPLLPPLHAPGLGEGRTPLIPLGPDVLLKDESRNPTWSHKDRLNRCTASAAVGAGAPGIVVSSSGNHGASAAAYAARAGLPCVVLASATMPGAVASFLHSYGALVLPVPEADRWPLMRQIVERTGFHAASNTTVTHTGHGFGPEGYKAIAYEILLDAGVPDAVFVPTGYGELLFGVWKGFAELRRLGLTDRVPQIYSCEPAAGGPLAAAVRTGRPATRVGTGPTDAYAISCEVGGYRGVVALRESAGRPLLVDDRQLRAAQAELAGQGIWVELSSAAGLAGLAALKEAEGFEGRAVCISTSSGFKDRGVGATPVTPLDASWSTVDGMLKAAGISV